MKMTQPSLKPILSNEIFQRVQLDLIDMRHNKDDQYCWIGHAVDHNGQFHVLWPQTMKTGEQVKSNLRSRWLAYFGLPNILQSDNGLEFKNKDVVGLLSDWDGRTNVDSCLIRLKVHQLNLCLLKSFLTKNQMLE